MRIELDIPDWANTKNLYLVSALDEDIELVAYKEINKEWKVKEIRCPICGDCCRKWINANTNGGFCNHLKDNKCDLGKHMPFSCVITVIKKDFIPTCVVKYK